MLTLHLFPSLTTDVHMQSCNTIMLILLSLYTVCMRMAIERRVLQNAVGCSYVDLTRRCSIRCLQYARRRLLTDAADLGIRSLSCLLQRWNRSTDRWRRSLCRRAWGCSSYLTDNLRHWLNIVLHRGGGSIELISCVCGAYCSAIQ